MATSPLPIISPEHYLELDRQAERPSEYHDGEMFPMEAATVWHNLIGGNVYRALYSALAGRSCRVLYGSNRVRIPNLKKYLCPDLAVVCGSMLFEDGHEDTLLNPSVLIEVLSPSTNGYDRGEKFHLYRLLPSFKEYVLVSQDCVLVEVFHREDETNWHFQVLSDLEAVVRLESLGVTIPVRDIYSDIEFPTQD